MAQNTDRSVIVVSTIDGDHSLRKSDRQSKNRFHGALTFKLDFLQPADVAMGRQFAAILPVLWMKAGAIGPCPEPPAPNAHWLIPADCPFVVLMRESRFREFLEKVRGRADLTHVYLVTNSDSAFHDMRAELPDHLEIIQLYKSYLENFRINTPTPSRSQP